MQAAPSNKAYSQALVKLKELARKYSTVKTRDVDTLAAEVQNTLQELATINDTSMTLKYSEVMFGSVPSSFDMNVFLQSLSQDINVLIDELDILKASSVHTHNFIKTELLKSQEQNDRLHNKIKTLQLFGSGEDSSILYVGDYFYNDDYIDWDLTPSDARVDLIKGDQITLGVLTQSQAIGSNAKLEIVQGSNGIPGNNQEVFDSTEPITFVKEAYRDTITQQLKGIIDQEPNTVFEFEKYEVSSAEREKAKNFNFAYSLTGSKETGYLNDLATGTVVSWADGVVDSLKLNLIIDLTTPKILNAITFNPYGLPDNLNGPLLIKSVSISTDKNTWIDLAPNNIWVANGVDQNTVNIESNNIIIGTAMFKVDAELTQYIRFNIEQPRSNDVKIGHLYYIDKNTPDADLPIATRHQGAVPPVDKIWAEKDPKGTYQNSLVQKREAFNGKRWAIGIRDIAAYTATYKATSTMVSKRFYVPGGVDRVSLEADVLMPEGFESDTAWVKFYVSPDDGATWHQISRIQDDYLGIPEIIAYNDNTPQELRLPGVQYYETTTTPTSLRVKIEIDRPTGNDTLTPSVSSYKLKIKHRAAQ